MKLEIILIDKEHFNESITVESSLLKRKWMDETNHQYAYRCLPLNIANQHGWAIYPKKNIVASWDGDTGGSVESIKIYENPDGLATSHFGHGVLTFHMPFLIRLEPEYSLYIAGAPNHHIKSIQSCIGIFEADWAPYNFTMNWRFTHDNEIVTFTPKDPICFFFPIPRNIVSDTETKFSTLDEQDEKYRSYWHRFGKSRGEFLEKNDNPSDWQKHYFKGLYPDETKCPYDHITKIKPNEFK